jgi:hypothetical protein
VRVHLHTIEYYSQTGVSADLSTYKGPSFGGMDVSTIQQLGRGRIVYRTCIDDYLEQVNNSNDSQEEAITDNSTWFMSGSPMHNSIHYRVIANFEIQKKTKQLKILIL